NAQKGVKNNDGSYTFTVKDVQSMEYRLYNRPDWDHPEVDSIGAERKNRIVEYPAGAVTNITVIGWKNLANGIPQIALDKSTVFASKGTIVVNGAKSLVELFNVSGQRIASVKTSGTYTSKKLTSGLYIVRVDGVTKKVVVK
ncbi:MAG: T9SS type A sorting domain-containing protein, partial [Bacteroidales bacterium]